VQSKTKQIKTLDRFKQHILNVQTLLTLSVKMFLMVGSNTKPVTISFPSKQYGRGGFTMTRLWDK
jgi:hypothetical protein